MTQLIYGLTRTSPKQKKSKNFASNTDEKKVKGVLYPESNEWGSYPNRFDLSVGSRVMITNHKEIKVLGMKFLPCFNFCVGKILGVISDMYKGKIVGYFYQVEIPDHKWGYFTERFTEDQLVPLEGAKLIKEDMVLNLFPIKKEQNVTVERKRSIRIPLGNYLEIDLVTKLARVRIRGSKNIQIMDRFGKPDFTLTPERLKAITDRIGKDFEAKQLSKREKPDID